MADASPALSPAPSPALSVNPGRVLVPAIAWIISAQYFVVQYIVATAWTTPFSLTHNYISDLGNTACADTEIGYVCSPLHGVMNASFVFEGLLMIIGGLMFARLYRANRLAWLGFLGFVVGGVGSVIVGLTPENTNLTLHTVGALLPFLIGNIGLLLLGLSRFTPSRAFNIYTLVSAVVALLGLGLFALEIYPGLGAGGMERITDYPQVIWMIVFGVYSLRQIIHRNPDA